MFLSVVILGRFTTETHAMALYIGTDTPHTHLHHVTGRNHSRSLIPDPYASAATIITKVAARTAFGRATASRASRSSIVDFSRVDGYGELAHRGPQDHRRNTAAITEIEKPQ